MNLNLTLFGQAITFLILVLFTWKFVWPPLVKAMEDREEKIRKGLSAADLGDSLLKDAKLKVSEMESAAILKSRQIVENAEKSSQIFIEGQKKVAEVEAKKIIDNANYEITKMVAVARDDLRKEFAELVSLAVSQIIAREVNMQNHQDVIQSILSSSRSIESEYSSLMN